MSSTTNGLPGLDSSSAPSVVPLSRWQKIRMVVKVVELRLRFIALMAATGLIFGYWDTIKNHYEKWTRPPGVIHSAASDTEFYCPMHPTVIQPTPGSCPICGMPLSKRKIGEKETLPIGVTARVRLASSRIEQAGVKTVEISYEPLAETITTVGSVVIDERRLKRISSKIRDRVRVESLFVNFTGITVKAGQPLAEVYGPELYQATRELLLAQQRANQPVVASRSELGRTVLGRPDELLNASRQKLVLWGLSDVQIDEILVKGVASTKMPILSPIDGVVVKKNVVEGQYIMEGEAMFEIADLTHVWVQAQIYEDQIDLVRVGQSVEAKVETYPGQIFRGVVAFRDPVLNPQTRTVNVRYDLDNADGRLMPGMFATVTFATPVAETPAFRDLLAHMPAPKDLTRRVSLTVDEQKLCLVTNLKLGSMGDPVAIEIEGKKIWMCCDNCETQLKANPAKFLTRLAGPPKDGVLAVPESAVIDTGTRQIVYVEVEPGVYEGRVVVLGALSGDVYPVLSGLFLGDRVATAGSFLIDAETRLNASPGPVAIPPSGEQPPVAVVPAAVSKTSTHVH